MKKLAICVSSIALILEGIFLYIQCNLFYQVGLYADDHGTSVVIIYGGWNNLLSQWATFLILLLLMVLSAILLIIAIRWTVSSRKNERKKQ